MHNHTFNLCSATATRRWLMLLLLTLPVTAAFGQTTLFNREWRFALGDHQGAEQADFDDADWQHIGLPHSFSIPYFESKHFYMGYGWYRKTFRLNAKTVGKSVSLEFDGVFQDAEVYVNGVLSGRHIGGYTGFSVDISNAIRKGDNLVAVRVNNIWRPDVPPRAGEHVFSGGIYRDVRLSVKSPVHVAWAGTTVTTPGLAETDGATARVSVATEVENASDKAHAVRVVHTVYSPGGKKVTTFSSAAKQLPPRQKAKFSTESPDIRQPSLWSPETPRQYRLVTSVESQGCAADKTSVKFGFRWMEWTADRGFFLNGRHVWLHGANVHQDQAGWGDAVTDSAAWRDVRMVKDAGMNFIRGSHYPHSPAFVHACDELGVMFWSEAPFWGTGGNGRDGWWAASAYPTTSSDTAAFENHCLQQLEEMIRIHRNSPSVIVWSMCNEPFFTAWGTMGGVRRLLTRMVALTHRLDPTRKAAIGGCQRPTDGSRIDHIGDVAGYNGDGATISEFQNPGIANIVSEYGSTIDRRPGKLAPGWGDLAKDEGYKGRAWRSGQAIWCGFDHGTIAKGDFGRMGFIDYQRIPKQRYYWYREENRGIPAPAATREGQPAALRLTASKVAGIRADGTDDAHLLVSVVDKDGNALNSSPDVTLRIVSGPGEFPTGSSITFAAQSDIAILDGKAAITIRSYYAGTTVVEASSPGLAAARLTLGFSDAPRYKPGTTPPVAERPYRRFEAGMQPEVPVRYGKGNPSFASSMQSAHTSPMATDGDAGTYWMPEANDAQPTFTLDTERCIYVRGINVTFSGEAAYRYAVEGSLDGEHWFMLHDMRKNEAPVQSQLIPIDDSHILTRFVRLTFVNASQATVRLAELSVDGAE